MLNPFTPVFGKIPLCLAGRDDIINNILSSLNDWNGNPNRTTIISGDKGTGKTVLLNYIQIKAQENGWISVNVTCMKGMNEVILNQIQEAASEFLESKDTKKLSGVSIGQFVSFQWDTLREEKKDFRTNLTRIVKELNAQDIGLLIEVDEVDVGNDELEQLISTYQHFVGEDRKVALLMAGLPFNIIRLSKDKRITFTRRARIRTLERIPDGASANAIEMTLKDAGREIEPDALNYAVKKADGFAYLIQLIGYYMFSQGNSDESICLKDAKTGVKYALRDMEDHIYKMTYYELSDVDKKFLNAMMQDKKQSSTAQIAKRMDCSVGYASRYRSRLQEQGIIRSPKRGYVEFDMPGFREFFKKEYAEESEEA